MPGLWIIKTSIYIFQSCEYGTKSPKHLEITQERGSSILLLKGDDDFGDEFGKAVIVDEKARHVFYLFKETVLGMSWNDLCKCIVNGTYRCKTDSQHFIVKLI